MLSEAATVHVSMQQRFHRSKVNHRLHRLDNLGRGLSAGNKVLQMSPTLPVRTTVSIK